MKHYSYFGFREFYVALGYKGGVIKRYFIDYLDLDVNLTLSLKERGIQPLDFHPEDWKIHLIDTGLNTMTGGRLRRMAKYIGNEPFMMTYGDGVCNVDLRRLVEFHRSHGKLATVTAVRPPARFGGLEFNGNEIARFTEKSQVGEGWINGGFFVLQPEVLRYIQGDDTAWEREPLERLSDEKQLMGYRHEDFWQCMDTLRDKRLLESLWETNQAPWRKWE
jgi:glucose-1-phosphate cytidylyltransferase